MENLKIDATRDTPEVLLDVQNSSIHISGKSYPENALEFYSPVIKWIVEKIKTLKPEDELLVSLKFDYFNTSSSKAILDMFDLFEESYNKGAKIKIDWHYDYRNDVMAECGEEFTEDFDIPINLIEDK